MTHKKNTEKRIDNPEFLRELIQTYLQEYLEQERAHYLGALPYERTSSRKGYRNGYKPRQLNTRVGKLFLSIPQTRDGSFSTELFERYQRSERALLSCLQEMVIKGVATRKVRKITEALCGLAFSKSQVSEICKKLDTQIQSWLNRPLDEEYPYLFVDARYEKIRRDHKVESHAILIAVGVNIHGKRDILGVEVCNRENETNWSQFFDKLVERGLKGVRLVISDAHRGLVSAVERYFPGCQWQRCQVHFKKNMLDKVRNKDKPWIKERLDDIFSAPDKQTAFHRLQGLIEELADRYPDVAGAVRNRWRRYFHLHELSSRASSQVTNNNGLERLNQKIKRRTWIIRIFPNQNSALRLIGTLCMEQAEEWMTGRQYLEMSLLEDMNSDQMEKTKRELVVA